MTKCNYEKTDPTIRITTGLLNPKQHNKTRHFYINKHLPTLEQQEQKNNNILPKTMEAFHPPMRLPFSYTFSSGAASSDALTIPVMDSRIWSNLPQRLLDRVIAFLPPPAFFRARCVCKRWYGLLFSTNFLDLYLQLSPRLNWFLFFKRKTLKNHVVSCNNWSEQTSSSTTSTQQGYLFDPYDIAWYRISFALMPPGFSPASSSGGLICWISDGGGPKTLLLCNPILGSLTQLPPTLRPRLYPSVGLAVSHSSVDATIAGDDLISPYAVKNLTAESFHIDRGGFYSLWATSSSLPRLCSFESSRMVHVNGKFYSMNYSPFSILAYDISSNNWWKIQAPMRRFLRSPSLVEGNGKLLLVAAVEKSKLNVPKSLRLWGLQPCGTTWIEMERMPHQLYTQFEEVEGGKGFDSVAHGEFIVFFVCGSDKALLYDMCRKIWQWIPPCPYLRIGGNGGGDEDGQLHGFAYEPRIATPVTGFLDQFTVPIQHFNG